MQNNGAPVDLGDLEPQSVQYRFGGRVYTLREPTADVAAKWRSSTVKGARLSEGRVAQLGEGVGESELVLVHLCLYDEGGKRVLLELVKAFPARITKVLFDKAMEMGQLGEKLSPMQIRERIQKLQEQLEENPTSDTESTSTSPMPSESSFTS